MTPLNGLGISDSDEDKREFPWSWQLTRARHVTWRIRATTCRGFGNLAAAKPSGDD